MENYRGIFKEIEAISNELGVHLSKENKEEIANGVGNFILDVINSAEKQCQKENRKIVTDQDIKHEIFARKLPFNEIFEN